MADPGLQIDDDLWDVDFDDLDLEDEIASGAFGVVYKGSYCGTPVAVKQLFDAENEIIQKLMHREVQILKSLRHPNVVNFMGLCNHETGIYIVTEYVGGGHLWGLLKQTATELPWPQRVQFAVDVSQAMNYLHKRKMLHRDLKTKNLLVDEHRRVKVCDFGFARTFEAEKQDIYMTKTGTALWMAPEMYMGEPYSSNADVFSFGVILREIITRSKPPERVPKNRFGFDMGEFLAGVPGDCPPELLQVAVDCTATDPADRPSFSAILPRLKALLRELKSKPAPSSSATTTTTASSPAPTTVEPVVTRTDSTDASGRIPIGNLKKAGSNVGAAPRRPARRAPQVAEEQVSEDKRDSLSRFSTEGIDLAVLDDVPQQNPLDKEMMAQLSNLDKLLDSQTTQPVTTPAPEPHEKNPPPFMRERAPTAIVIERPPGLDMSQTAKQDNMPSADPPPGPLHQDSALLSLFQQPSPSTAASSPSSSSSSSASSDSASDIPLTSVRNLITVLQTKQSAASREIANIPELLEKRLLNVRKDLLEALDKSFDALSKPSNAFQALVKKALKVPAKLNKTEWIVACTVEIYHLLYLLHGTIHVFCTAESCPTMSASDTIHYTWADGVKVTTPIQVSARDYVHYLNEYTSSLLHNTDTFPEHSRFSRKAVMSSLRVVSKRLFRILCHIYFCHWSLCHRLSIAPHFKVILTIAYHFFLDFKLVDKRNDATSLDPLLPILSEIGII